MRRDLPSGKVTFLFTDVEGSTKLLHDRALAEHRRIVRDAVGRHGGVAVALYRDNLRTARELGNRGLEAEALANLGLIARDRGELDDATTQLREAVRLTHYIGHMLAQA